jgi:hypothetical protein
MAATINTVAAFRLMERSPEQGGEAPFSTASTSSVDILGQRKIGTFIKIGKAYHDAK